MNVTGLWSFALPPNISYKNFCSSVKTHLETHFDALVIDQALLSATEGFSSAKDFQHLALSLPEHIRVQFQQQHGIFPNWSQSMYRSCEMLRSEFRTASGTGGGVLSTDSSLPHHSTWMQQQTQHPNAFVPTTCPIAIPPATLFNISLSDDISGHDFLCIPQCPDATMLSTVQQHPEQWLTPTESQQLTANIDQRVDMTTNIHKPLAQIESYLQLVCGSLGSEIVPMPKAFSSGFLSDTAFTGLGVTALDMFSITKDIIAYPSGNMIQLSLGRATKHHARQVTPTTTIIVEIQLLGCYNLGHDPLLFQELFHRLLPPSFMFIWRYANSPFGAAKTYRYSDICPQQYHTSTLQQIYTRALQPITSSAHQVTRYVTTIPMNISEVPLTSTINTTGTITSSSSSSSAAAVTTATAAPSDNNQTENVHSTTTTNNNTSTLSQQPSQDQQLHLNNNNNTTSNNTSSLHSIALDNTDDQIIPGVCILPSMTTIFQQYHLSHISFHLEHLALMYAQIFLHPHVVIE